jgi:hypothetical protein
VVEQKKVEKTSQTTAVLLDDKGVEVAKSSPVDIPALPKKEDPKVEKEKPQWQPTPGMGGGPGRQRQAPLMRNHGLQMIR